MSDVMLLGALRTPLPDAPTPLMLSQYVDRARQAADRIESDAVTIAQLRAALRGDRRFAGWFRELPSGMSYRLWEQGGATPCPGDIALYEI